MNASTVRRAALLVAGAIATSLCALELGRASPASELDVQRLKAAYLRCEQAAMVQVLGIGDAARCSIVYEQVLARGFDGDFRRLLAWWQAERTAAARRDRLGAPTP